MTSIVLIVMYNALRRATSGDNKVCDFWCQILSSERIASTTYQHLRVILNLLEGSSEQLRRCEPGEASDTRFYPKPRWFSTDQPTKSSCISQTVSRLSENSSSRPAPVFVEFRYSVIYGKMSFQQEITDAEFSTSYVAVNLRHYYQIACSAHPTSTAVTG